MHKKLSTPDSQDPDIFIEETLRNQSASLSNEEEYWLLKITYMLVVCFTMWSYIRLDPNPSSWEKTQEDFHWKIEIFINRNMLLSFYDNNLRGHEEEQELRAFFRIPLSLSLMFQSSWRRVCLTSDHAMFLQAGTSRRKGRSSYFFYCLDTTPCLEITWVLHTKPNTRSFSANWNL